jgi:proteic killer suppression protein
MIQSFKGKHAAKLWAGQRTKLPADLLRRSLDKLYILNHCATLDELKTPPSNYLEALKHDRLGQHSIRINDQWRICFRWIDGHAHDVEITDYH